MNSLAYTSLSLLLALAQTATCQDPSKADDSVPSPPATHPTPSFAREKWIQLDGTWDYTTTPAAAEKPLAWNAKISVPSIIGSPASKIDQKPAPEEKAWFRRSFKHPKPTPGHRVYLHFAGIGGESMVWVNDTLAMAHQGSLGQFDLDITDLLTKDENAEQKLIISALTSADDPTPGIIRSTWLEEIPRTHLSNLQIKTDNSKGTVSALASIWGQANFHKLEFIVSVGEDQVASATSQYDYKKGGYAAKLTIPKFKKWEPENPQLYTLRLRLLNKDDSVFDEVFSHFAFRDVGNLAVASSTLGIPRLTLNGKPTPLLGVEKTTSSAGQTDEQIRAEIARIQKAGFQLLHISNTFENPRFYYLADQLGLLIWQDLPTPAPAEGAASKAQLQELSRAIAHYLRHPSIIIWPEAYSSAGDLPYTAGQKTGDLLVRKTLTRPEKKVALQALGVVGIAPTQKALTTAKRLLGENLSVAVFTELPEEE